MAAKDTQSTVEIEPADAKRLAESIKRIDKAMKELAESGLSRKALVTLLADSTGVAKRDINAVLNGLETLGNDYLERAK